jgi:hypothetical protein
MPWSWCWPPRRGRIEDGSTLVASVGAASGKLSVGLTTKCTMAMLSRLWAGIVGAVAGVALALVMQIAGQMTVGLSIGYLEKLVLSFGIAGFIIGFVVGNRRIGTPGDKTHSDL